MKEYFGYSLYSFYDLEKDLVDSKVMIMTMIDDDDDNDDDADGLRDDDNDDDDKLNLLLHCYG